MSTPRYEFYETDEKLILSVFDRGVDSQAVSVHFEPRKLSYKNGDKTFLPLEPLKGQIDPNKCSYTVSRVKVEISLAKMVLGRWGRLVGEAPDPLASSAAPSSPKIPIRPKKNWEGITTDMLTGEKERTTEDDPNVGGDSTVNSFFQKIFADADDDTRRAMMKSFQESGGTTLSTNWEEVGKGKVESFARYMSSLALIVAATTQNGIGRNGNLPWHIPADLAYFSRVTTNAPAARLNAVVMGRKTWESIPHRFRPLKKRINVVLSRNKDYDLFPQDTAPPDSTHLCSDLKTAVETFGNQNNVHRLFVIGGSLLYQEALAKYAHSDRILMTRLHKPEFDCDVFFPDILSDGTWRRASHEEHCNWVGFEVPAGIQTENGVEFEYQMWIRSSE